MVRDTAGNVFKAYGFRGFPSSVIADRNGQIVHEEEGFDIGVFIQVIDSLLMLTGIKEMKGPTGIPQGLTILGNYPNPFNPSTRIVFKLNTSDKSSVPVHLSLFNILGQQLETLIAREMVSGIHPVTWNASGYSAGTYFYRIQAVGQEKFGKLIYRK
ncbi:MAG TPA: T9SS type A sorting domain-containing protein [Calditrichaeota bacterium]|nr:T9SS type A sorting domain-containing protein [Calditrichota bacterium]